MMMLGWETEGRALGGEEGETVRARDCLKEKRERRREGTGLGKVGGVDL